MSFSIAVVEDDDKDYENIQAILRRYEKENHVFFQVSRFISGEAFLDDYHPQYQLVLLDVELPGINGITTAERLRKLDENVALIFTTHVASLAIEGYRFHAMDYMLKPIRYEDISIRMKKLLQKEKPKNISLAIPLEGRSGIKILNIYKLIYVESCGHTIIYHTTEGNFKVRDKANMKNLESKLSSYSFVRCNVSYLVNLAYLSEIDGNEVVLQNDERLPIARTRKKEFVDAFFSILSDNGGIL